MQETLFLGNLSAQRDWGHAKDYIRAMYLILQQDEPDDYVIATGITTTIRDFVKKAAAEIGMEITFTSKGPEEKGWLSGLDEGLFSRKVGEIYLPELKERHATRKALLIAVDPAYFRPTEVDLLIGDATKARNNLGWTPEYDLKGLISDMLSSDIHLMKMDCYLKEGGYRTLNYFEG
jgi:GDPmannose 4,6-dehydratase